MAQSSQPNVPAENEHRGLLPAMPEPGAQPEGWLTRAVRILFGWKAASTRADLEHVLTAEQPQSGFSPEEAAMLKNILGLRETRIERIMMPRADIIAVQQDIALGDLVKVFQVAAHSRLVVYNDTLDDPTGMVHIRDLVAFMAARAAPSEPAEGEPEAAPSADLNFANIDLSMPLSAAKIVREILYAPPSMPVLDLLAKNAGDAHSPRSRHRRIWRQRRADIDRGSGRAHCRRYRRRARRGRGLRSDAAGRRLVFGHRPRQPRRRPCGHRRTVRRRRSRARRSTRSAVIW